MEMVNIKLNGEICAVTAPLTVEDLLRNLGLLEKKVAVELNGNVIPRSVFGKTPLQSEDKVEIIKAIGGG